MTATPYPPPLSPTDVFFVALAAGRTVPEDETHAVFANCTLEQLYKVDHPRSAEAHVAQPKSASNELPAPDARAYDVLSEVWRACSDAVAQRIAGIDPAGFTPAGCAAALRARTRISKLQCLPYPNKIEDAQ